MCLCVQIRRLTGPRQVCPIPSPQLKHRPAAWENVDTDQSNGTVAASVLCALGRGSKLWKCLGLSFLSRGLYSLFLSVQLATRFYGVKMPFAKSEVANRTAVEQKPQV